MQQPPNPYQYHPQFQPPLYTTKPPRRYRGWVLTALVLTYITSLVFLFTEIVAMSGVPASPESSSSSSGILTVLTTILIISLYCFIFGLDGRNVLSLFGRIHWKRLNGWQRVGLVFLYLCIFIIPGLYLAFATQYFLRVRQQTLGGEFSEVWSSYRAKSGTTQLSIALVTTIVLISFVGLTSVFAVIDRENALTFKTVATTTAPTTALTQPVTLLNSTATPTAIAQPIVTPTPLPTMRPTPRPRPTQPPVHPTPTTPACQAVNNNPWCYNFNLGNLIYIPPSGFCNYFNCIPTFYGSDDPGDGYIAECNDGTYSQSGGESGACSYHGGVMRPLYSH